MPKGIRLKENCTITISLPKTLVAEIDQLARADRRSRSNWIVKHLEEFIKRKVGPKIAEVSRAASNIIVAVFSVLSIALDYRNAFGYV